MWRRNLARNYFVANFKDYRFLQVFYPTRGVLAWYDRETGQRQSLPGANDPVVLGTLGAAYAEGGRFAEAALAAGKALTLAAAQDNPSLVQALGSRVAAL